MGSVKDAETTQNSLGVRVSGLQVWRASEGTVFKPERDWARKLTDETIGSAFQLFASGGEERRLEDRGSGRLYRQAVQSARKFAAHQGIRDDQRKLSTACGLLCRSKRSLLSCPTPAAVPPDHIKAKELYAHPEHGILHKLSGFKAWMESQCSYQFFQSSVLIVYEGEATRIEDANVRVAWVDFAHTFQTVGGARDENVLRALNSLLAMMEAATKA